MFLINTYTQKGIMSMKFGGHPDKGIESPRPSSGSKTAWSGDGDEEDARMRTTEKKENVLANFMSVKTVPGGALGAVSTGKPTAVFSSPQISLYPHANDHHFHYFTTSPRLICRQCSASTRPTEVHTLL